MHDVCNGRAMGVQRVCGAMGVQRACMAPGVVCLVCMKCVESVCNGRATGVQGSGCGVCVLCRVCGVWSGCAKGVQRVCGALRVVCGVYTVCAVGVQWVCNRHAGGWV